MSPSVAHVVYRTECSYDYTSYQTLVQGGVRCRPARKIAIFMDFPRSIRLTTHRSPRRRRRHHQRQLVFIMVRLRSESLKN